jgi:putative transcriptional regulator
VTRKFVESFDRAITASPFVLSSAIEKYLSPDGHSLYIKGIIRFIDSSSLDIATFALVCAGRLSLDKYRFHYMDKKRQMMKKEHFEKLVASIKEAGEIKAGRKAPSRVYEIRPPEIKRVRENLNVSQNEFALMIGVSVRTLQNWEQGRRQPEGPAKALLRIASKNPSAVLEALHTE